MCSVKAFTQCATGEATLDYVPADRPLRLKFVAFNGSVYTIKNAGSNEAVDWASSKNASSTADKRGKLKRKRAPPKGEVSTLNSPPS